MEGTPKRKRLIVQITTVVMLSFLFCMLVSGVMMYSNAVNTVMEIKYQESVEVANMIENDMTKFASLDWLVTYWLEHAEDMDINYTSDDDYYAKVDDFMARAMPEGGFRNVDVNALTPELQKEYAEVVYTHCLMLFNDFKLIHNAKYVSLLVPNRDVTEVTFIMSGATKNEKRGDSPDDIYYLGVTVPIYQSTQKAIMTAYSGGEPSRDNVFVLPGITSWHNYDAYIPLKFNGKIIALINVAHDADEYTSVITSRFAFISLGALLLFALSSLTLIHLLRLRVFKPVRHMQVGVDAFTRNKNINELKVSLEPARSVGSVNEIDDLVIDLEELGQELVDYIGVVTDWSAKAQKMKSELELSSRIQMSALQKDFDILPKEWKADICADMVPAKNVGGDFYGFRQLDDSHLALYMADVSGKGIPGALFMMKVKVILENAIKYVASPAAVLKAINDIICEENDAEMFVTIWLGILDMTTGIIKTANAGHEYPIVHRSSGRAEVINDKHGIVIGAYEDAEYENCDFKLERGDSLIVYTDGVTEANNPDEELFGMDRLCEAIEKIPFTNAREAIDSLKRNLDEFADGEEQFDDQTIMILKIN